MTRKEAQSIRAKLGRHWRIIEDNSLPNGPHYYLRAGQWTVFRATAQEYVARYTVFAEGVPGMHVYYHPDPVAAVAERIQRAREAFAAAIEAVEPGGMTPATLAFADWHRQGSSVEPEEYTRLSMGNFHGGSCFAASVRLNVGDAEDLAEATKTGAYPVFRLEVER